MVKENDNRNSGVRSETSHRCHLFCLGPLTFHPQAVGSEVRLSKGCRLAARTEGTFRNGVVFSSRPVKIKERIRLRVDKNVHRWQGALRVGFTNVAPSARSLPLPSMAIPDLTNSPGHWAAPVHESCCIAGSELQFWVSSNGTLYVSSHNCTEQKLLTGVDLRQPLWAMIDVYGQTCSIFLLGSEKRGLIHTNTSCPVPDHLTSPDTDNRYNLNSAFSSLSLNRDDSISCFDVEISTDEECVVCTGRKSTFTLPCGHRCLCNRCAAKVLQVFGTCPLCRHVIEVPSVEG